MEKAKAVVFTGVIRAAGAAGGAYVELAPAVEKTFVSRGRVKVVCTFESLEYRGSLVRMGTECHLIGIPKDIRDRLGRQVGDRVTVSLTEDTGARTVEIPALLQAELQMDSRLENGYDKLSYTRKWEIAALLNGAKKDETRKSRIAKILQELREC